MLHSKFESLKKEAILEAKALSWLRGGTEPFDDDDDQNGPSGNGGPSSPPPPPPPGNGG